MWLRAHHMAQAQSSPPFLRAHRPVGHQAESRQTPARNHHDEQAQHTTALLRQVLRNAAYML